MQAEKTIEDVYGPAWRNMSMITLAPELQFSSEVIKHLSDNGITVSLGNYSQFNLYFSSNIFYNSRTCLSLTTTTTTCF